MLTRRPAWAFGRTTAVEALTQALSARTRSTASASTTRDVPGASRRRRGARLPGRNAEGVARRTSTGCTPYRAGATLAIDEATRRSLELTRTLRDGRREGSLLGVIDRTVTPMGARLLADWLATPLTDVAAINARLDAVAELVARRRRSPTQLREPLAADLRPRAAAGPRHDRPRHAARPELRRPHARAACRRSRPSSPARKQRCCASSKRALDLCPDIRGPLEAALVDDCPLTSRDGGFIRAGYQRRARRAPRAGRRRQAVDRPVPGRARSQRTGIPSLKVGFNKVFGYYIEVTQHPQRQDPGRLHPQADGQERRALHHARAEGVRRARSSRPTSRRKRARVRAVRRAPRPRRGRRPRRLQATAAVLAQLDVLAGARRAGPRSAATAGPTIVAEPVLEIDRRPAPGARRR